MNNYAQNWVRLGSLVPGRAPEADTEAMTVNDFGWDKRHRRHRHLPRGSPADVVRTRRGDGSDANRDARFGVL